MTHRSPRGALAILIGIVLLLGSVALGGQVHAAPSRDDSPTATATTGPTDTPTPGPTATATPIPPGAGGKNVVKVTNKSDNTFRADGRVQLNEIAAMNVSPLNEAYAYSQCKGCQTLAVALQIDLISKKANIVHPQNIALAVNYQCSQCSTVALAYQYVIGVDDPKKAPSSVQRLVRLMNDQLRVLHGKKVSVDAAVAAVQKVIAEVKDLAQYLQSESAKETKPSGRQKKTHS